MSNPFQNHQGDQQQFDAKHAMDDAAHLGAQIWNEMRTEGPKIVDYCSKTPIVADTAGALCSLAIVLTPEAPPVAIAVGTLGVTMFGAKAVYDLAKPAIEKAGQAVVQFPHINQ
jgi:hypothetical protein